MAKKNPLDGAEIFKCARCNYVSNDPIQMRNHIDEVHGGSGYKLYSRIKSTRPVQKRDPGFSASAFVIGIFAGFIIAVASFSLLSSLGILLLLFPLFFMLVLSYAREHDSKFLRGFGIGGLGIILGFIVDAIVGYGAKKGMAYRILVFIFGTALAIIVIISL